MMERWVSLLVFAVGLVGLVLGVKLIGGGLPAFAFALVWGLILVPHLADFLSRRSLDDGTLSELDTQYWRSSAR